MRFSRKGLGVQARELGVMTLAYGGGPEGEWWTCLGWEAQASLLHFLCPGCSLASGNQSAVCPGHSPVTPGMTNSAPAISSWKL